MEEAKRLLCGLGRYTLEEEAVDEVRWKLMKAGVFTVKSVYKALQMSAIQPFPWQMVWRSCVQPKISFFTWEVAWGRILTLDKLQGRGIYLVNRCFLCQEAEELVDHLLLHCSKTRVLWELLFSLFGVNWIISGSVRDMLLGWKGTFVGKRRKKVWQTAPSCLFWIVWKARNRIVFKEDVLSIQKLKYLFLFLLWSKTKLSIENSPSTFDGFIDWVSCK